MRSMTIVLGALLTLWAAGAATAAETEFAIELPTDVPQQDFLACYLAGLGLNNCYTILRTCYLLGFIPGMYTFCYYI